MKKSKLIIVAGLPATGKSTVSRKLANAFDLPILEKDEIKEDMFDTIGFADRTQKRALDTAANRILLRAAEAVLKGGGSLLLVNNFDACESERVQAMLDACGCRAVTVFLNGDADVLHARYVERDRKKSRHPGHTFIDRYPIRPGDDPDAEMPREYFAERFEKMGMADFKLKGKRIELDATYPEKIDMDALIREIAAAFEEE